MEQIVWSEKFSVGIELFDIQHQGLISILNKMIGNPTATTRSRTISDILSDMTRYAQEHFKAEEELMVKYDYPQFEQHRKQHLLFREKVVEICLDTSNGEDSVPQILLEYLQQWWTQHILHEDMEYKQFFYEKDIKM